MNNLHLYTSSRFRKFPKTFSLRRKVPWWYQILDPGSEFVAKWNHIFLVTCLIALFLDPLYFYLPIVGNAACMEIDVGLGVFVTFFRTVADLFFLMHMIFKFRTAFVAPSSRVFGRGELVMDPRAIAIHYLKSSFVTDLFATLPLPQIVIWGVIPALRSRTAAHANHTLSLIVLIQYVPRFFVMFPLNRRIIKTTGVVAKTAWSGAAYNLILYMLASHVLGASWYVLSIQRQHECWTVECAKEMNGTHSPSCSPLFLDCSSLDNPERQLWLRVTHVVTGCDAKNDDNANFQFGMFASAFTNDVASATFIDKYFYCLWWGLKNLSSYGQNLVASTISGETVFSILICIGGLVLFSHLIGNMQSYLQSTTARLEEWRVRRRDTEEWMRHRQLPPELQERVRRFVQYKWLATRGVDEESILRALPLDLRRQIQRHLCLALVRRVPFFAQMDDQLLDAICERLFSSLNTKETNIVREGDPVNEMLFIIRGEVESSTTNGGRTGFFNSITLRAGDFCGEELLTWALMPTSTANLPLSTRTVKCLTEVEAFALRAEDLKFVASQFKRLHSKKLQHAFRYYSHQWRTWGACFLQAAWRRHSKRKLALELARQESLYYMQNSYSDDTTSADYDVDGGAGGSSVDNANNAQHLSATLLASKFAANTKKGVHHHQHKITALDLDDPSLKMPKLFKPEDPDFYED
ncbi:cNMP_binding domain-containing protein/Ion_trans domain-containing protein [Cephalotus follicularis]|uniref:cNMP_binding domain-containing protein/Ion_trans domain-containing protein n=1 Tax=Cephalotus follicularis TaxID=3775 RepID=A0A1Q3B5E8_CEPFO|nr:cNMP_binding domain-containing protein/Ion_trans domain-containing protein [Cephalotus follicularis]